MSPPEWSVQPVPEPIMDNGSEVRDGAAMADAIVDLRRELAWTREALAAAEAKFESIVLGSLHGIVIQQGGRIVYANPGMAVLFGYADPALMVGLDPFKDLIDEAYLVQFRKRTESVYRGALVSPVPHWRAKRPDGLMRWMSSTAHRSVWNGQPAVTSFYMDVTARRAAELAMQESQALYRAALTAGRMGAWETDYAAGVRHWTAEGQARTRPCGWLGGRVRARSMRGRSRIGCRSDRSAS